ncbi:MAG: hypothetical protein V4567_05345 [Pseudomonadota bacterium]
MPQPLIDFYTSLTTHNWFAVAALAIMIGTQLLNSLPVLRTKIWAKIPLGYRWAVPVLAASLTAFVHGYQAHEALGASIWDAVKIALSAMGGAAALKESPLPWGSTGPGGVPLPKAPPATPLPVIPPLADALEADDDKTPVDGHGPLPPSDPPPTAA